MMKNTILTAVAVAFSLLLLSYSAVSQIRAGQTLNSLWEFYKGPLDNPPWKKDHNPSASSIINIPHTWNDKDVLPDNNRGYYRGGGWYHRVLPDYPIRDDKRTFLHFEGANQITTVFVNEQKAGTHYGGYTAFTFDITEYLRAGHENTISVHVDNSHNPDVPPLSADFTFFGGIYRDIRLFQTSDIHFNLLDHGSQGVFVDTEVTEEGASVLIRGQVRNTLDKRGGRATLKVILEDPSGNVVSTTNQTIRFSNDSIANIEVPVTIKGNIRLWSPDSPELYSLALKIESEGILMDELTIPVGLRYYHFDPSTGFHLNGKPLKLMGANRHQDYQGLGNAISDDVHRSDMELIKNMGGNFVRLAHYPQDPAVLRAADELGLLIWEEIPLVNEVTLSEKHDENSENMLREMMRQHYNHPSVIIWGYMNEIYWAHRFLDEEVVEKHTEWTLRLANRLEQVAREEDPERYTAMALHNYPLYAASGLDTIPMIVSWNLYHGWYYDRFDDFGKFMDEQHRLHPDRIHIISEYGAGSDPRLHSTRPERFDFTVEGQKRFLESFLKQINDRPYIAGATVWNLIDFSSERRIDSNPHLNNKGIMMSDRTPKDPYFLFQASLRKEPYIKIAETNWTNRTGVDLPEGDLQPIQVYTNMASAELIVNGVSEGRKKILDHSATWFVPLSEGINEVEVHGDNGENSRISDYLEISYTKIPFITQDEQNIDIAINAGGNYSFFDDKGKITWVADKPYAPGSWGYVGGEPLYVGNKIGTKEDILTTYDFVPLFQAMREGANEYRFDVPDGWYEVELLFVEPYPKSRRFVDGAESPETSGGNRIFSVSVNDDPILQNTDLAATYGLNYPLRKTIRINAKKSEGVRIRLENITGKSLISGVRIKSLD